MTDRQKIVLISVLDKDKPPIINLAKPLADLGWEVWGSRGTARHLNSNDVRATDVADITGVEPILDHMVVTLHPKIHAGLLANKDKPEHWVDLKKIGASYIDMVCIDLYRVKEAIARYRRGEATLEDVIASIDIGGVAMLRSAAKGNRIVLSEPEDRDSVIEAIQRYGDIPDEMRDELRTKAFLTTLWYEQVIVEFFQSAA